jgi:hypothetical protein
MRRATVSLEKLLVLVVLACGSAADATAGDVSYLRRGKDSDSALIVDSGGRTREIRKGEDVGELGRLEEVDDEEIVFERALPDEERKDLERAGLAAPNVRRLHLRRRGQTRSAASLGDGATVFSTE